MEWEGLMKPLPSWTVCWSPNLQGLMGFEMAFEYLPQGPIPNRPGASYSAPEAAIRRKSRACGNNTNVRFKK